MNYYFPSILPSTDFSGPAESGLSFTVNSGENAIRLFLRSYDLPKGSRVAIPAFVCDSVKEAVIREGLVPFYLDLKADETFWTDYTHPDILSGNIRVVILVHLYGFLHPDTVHIMNVCRDKNIFLIHDTAQSYGVDETTLTYSSGLLYSFGPGKSSTAGNGAILKGLPREFYALHTLPPSVLSLQSLRSRLFLKSRVYGYVFTSLDKILLKLTARVPLDKKIRRMSRFQQRAAKACMGLIRNKQPVRRSNYEILAKAVKSSGVLQIPYDDTRGLYFKLIVKCQTDPKKFQSYLDQHQIPWFSIMNALHTGKEEALKLPQLPNTGTRFFEISSEASIPEAEIKRIAEILRKYR